MEVLKLMKNNMKLLDLTFTAERISQGNPEAEVPCVQEQKDEFDVMSGVLHSAMERLRVYEINLTQARAITAAGLRFELFIKEADSVSQAFRMALALLRCQIKSVNIMLAYAGKGDFYMLSCRENTKGESDITETAYFSHHSQVLTLLSGKNFVFMNNFTLKEHNINFISENARIACMVPLIADEKTRGYIILESDNEEALSVVKEEEFLIYVARELSGWMLNYEESSKPIPENTFLGSFFSKPAPETPETEKFMVETVEPIETVETVNVISLLRGLDGLDVDTALAAMGGLDKVYEKSLRLFVRLTPELEIYECEEASNAIKKQ